MSVFLKLEKSLREQGISTKSEESLAGYTSFKIGGRCRILIEPESTDQIGQVLSLCSQWNVPYLIIGNGSNMLISDRGYDGAVILLNQKFAEIQLLGEDRIVAQAGASLMKVCRFAAEHALSGLEFAYGIPATVGGAVYMNAGAYGGEMKDVLSAVEHFTLHGERVKLPVEKLELSYRHSIYTDQQNCILSAEFQLTPGDPEEIQSRMKEIMERRKSKQPLEFASAGSTFKRPENAFAAKLIEDCGLKGRTVGAAQVSEKHSGFVINRGGATCADVKALIKIIQQEVFRQSGIQLECEVKMIGESF